MYERLDTDRESGMRRIGVSRGLFVFRYDSSRGGGDAPFVRVMAENGDIEVITLDGMPEARLSVPGDAIVLRAERDSAVIVRVDAARPGGTTSAHFVLERLPQSWPSDGVARGFAAAPGAGNSAPALPAALSLPTLLAHVARRGDVAVGSGEWVCGPDLPMAIEGLQIEWPDRPAGVDILLSCTINNRGRKQCAPVQCGKFAGSRGKAAPIVAFSLSLIGAGASALHLACEALFLGAQVQSQEGTEIEFSGPTGREPLVGVRLQVRPVAVHAARPGIAPVYGERPLTPPAPAATAADRTQPVSTGSPSARVRVFRASRPTVASHHT